MWSQEASGGHVKLPWRQKEPDTRVPPGPTSARHQKTKKAVLAREQKLMSANIFCTHKLLSNNGSSLKILEHMELGRTMTNAISPPPATKQEGCCKNWCLPSSLASIFCSPRSIRATTTTAGDPDDRRRFLAVKVPPVHVLETLITSFLLSRGESFRRRCRRKIDFRN
jgi:hypothetical protein